MIDEVSTLPQTKNQLININTCRLFLNITHLSNIAGIDGKIINYKFQQGRKTNYPNYKFKGPNYTNLPPKAW